MTWRNWNSFLSLTGTGLWLTVGIFILLFAYVISHAIKKRIMSRFGTHDLVADLIDRRSNIVASINVALILGVLILSLISWAQPQSRGKTMNLKPRGLDILVALDFSKSMNVRDMHGSRLEHAKREMNKLIDSLGGDRVGLIAFAGTPMTYPLTEDYESAKMFWENLVPEDMPLGGTAIGRALASAKDLLIESRRSGDKRSQIIILLSDGEDLSGSPEKIASELNTQGIRVYTIGIGNTSGSLVPAVNEDGNTSGYMKYGEKYVTSSLDEKLLKKISELTGGKYFKASKDNFGTELVLKNIKDLKRTEGQKRKIEEKNEEFHWFIIPAIIFLIFNLLLLGDRELFKTREAQNEG
ncbi:MAG: VWA domain-containing protein [Deltaproteobacteria bacterium]|nr:VWA domain-containing protein [Deltaproteobacteria bacterium]